MIDKTLIERKLRKIEEFIREIGAAKIETYEQFKGDTVAKRFIERNIELSIEQMVDICKHFISGLDLPEPETYSDCIDALAKNEIVPDTAVNTFKTMVRFRNILIHGYDNVDDSITYALYKKNLDDFSTFVHMIRSYLQKKE